MFHECLPWDEQIRRTAVFYVRHALRFGDYAMAAMSDEHMPRLPSGDAYVHFHVDGVSVVRSRGQRYDRDASSTIADRSRGL